MKILEVLFILVLPLSALGAGWQARGELDRRPALVVTKAATAPTIVQAYADALCRVDVKYLAQHSGGQLTQVAWSEIPREAVGACTEARYLGPIENGNGGRTHLFVLRDRIGRDYVRALYFDDAGLAVWIQ